MPKPAFPSIIIPFAGAAVFMKFVPNEAFPAKLNLLKPFEFPTPKFPVKYELPRTEKKDEGVEVPTPKAPPFIAITVP